MKVGDLVKNLNSESRMKGIVVGWVTKYSLSSKPMPVVLWADGRCSKIVPWRVEKLDVERT